MCKMTNKRATMNKKRVAMAIKKTIKKSRR